MNEIGARTPFYEFFAGAGMARAGLGLSWTCLFANDIDAKKGASYARNFGADHLKVGDVANLTIANLPDAADLVWCSFPCQDVSLAGDRAGLDGARSSTFWPFWRLMQGLRAEGRAPQTIVIENVTGLITSHGGQDFDAICDALAGAGYRYGAVVIDAAHFVPQSRERVFIVAIDSASAIPAAITATGPATVFHPPGLVKAMRRQKVSPIWFNLPVPPARNTMLVDLVEDKPTGPFPQTGLWHPQAETDRLIKMMSAVNLAKLEEAGRTDQRRIGAFYKRMRPGKDGVDASGERTQHVEVRFDGVAGCLRKGSTGGSSVQNLLIADGASVCSRRLSAREAARLMGLPDSYKLPSDYLEGYDLVGDGVVVPAVKYLAEHVLEPFLRDFRRQRTNCPPARLETTNETATPAARSWRQP